MIQTAKNKIVSRQSNIELLRILSMLLIIVSHISLFSLGTAQMFSSRYYIVEIMRSISVCATNVFVLIRGYFGIKYFKQKIFALDFKTMQYTYILFALTVLLGIHTIKPTHDLKLLFPVITSQYWFITAYIVLCIISPLLNKILSALSATDLRKALITVFLIYYGVNTFCMLVNGKRLVSDFGYGIVNFVCLYFFGYYIRHYFENKHSFVLWMFLWALSCGSAFGVDLVMSKIKGTNYQYMMSYDNIFILLSALFLFIAFTKIDIGSNKIINRLSAACLSVYLIHINPSFSAYLFKTIFKVNKADNLHLLLAYLIVPVGVYISCFFIDCALSFLLKPLSNLYIKVLTSLTDKAKKLLKI